MPNRQTTDHAARQRDMAIEDALAASERLFADLEVDVSDEELSIGGLRRRRRSPRNIAGGARKTVSLVEENGVLRWRDDLCVGEPGIIEAGEGRRRRRAAGPSAQAAEETRVVVSREFPILAPNKIGKALTALDQHLNASLVGGTGLHALARKPDGSFALQDRCVVGPFRGRTLVVVHGTFSSSVNILAELAAVGPQFLADALAGPHRYDRVLFFDHPTLTVSPTLNALDLARAMAGSEGEIDVIAHSRGGLVVRWWLEAFGSSLKPSRAPRAVLVGSPLAGTSLAAPDKLRHALDLFVNIGTFAHNTLGLVGSANPFLWLGDKLVQVVTSVAGALAKGPVLDTAVALIPGLSAQSMVANNEEIARLQAGPPLVSPHYFAVMSNFEPAAAGWRFWRWFRKDKAGDAVADAIFPGDNDLVVDTASMDRFGNGGLQLAAPALDFGTSTSVWHCNYFRQPATIKQLQQWL